MSLRDYFSKHALLLALTSGALAANLFVLVARAGDSSHSLETLWFTGNVQKDGAPLTGTHALSFAFKKSGVEKCRTQPVSVDVGPDGNFRAPVPLGACPSDLFDGGDISFDVVIDDAIAAADESIGVVPYAKFAEQVRVSECPPGYQRDPKASMGQMTVCTQGADEVVRVGTGNSTFWIDRYEASVWSEPLGAGKQYGAGRAYPPTFPRHAQVERDAFVYAASKRDVPPSLDINWFQASRACRASGKRLPTGEEWLEAATGTPGGGLGSNSDCRVSERPPRSTGSALTCISYWGAQDMVGNAPEWTQDWFAGVQTVGPKMLKWNWPSELGGQGTWNVAGRSYNNLEGLPMAATRGGASWDGNSAGVFAFSLAAAPSDSAELGFRCMIPK